MIELKISEQSATELGATLTGLAALLGGAPIPVATIVAEADGTTTMRERGKPAPGSGRSRRTKEEIAEDEAAEKASGTVGEETVESAAEEPSEPETPAEEPKADAPTATREDVRKAIVAEAAKLDQAKRGDYVQSLLRPFGVAKLGDLPDEKLSALMFAVEAGAATDSALD